MNSIITVITGAESTDLTVLNTVKSELVITSNDEDAAIRSWITQASAAIAQYCNRVLAEEVLIEAFRMPRAEMTLQLDRYPVTAIDSITENDDDALDPDEDYEVNYDTGQVYRLSSDVRIPWSASRISVRYTAGYELLGGLPYEIERACILLVKQYRFAARRDPMIKSVDVYQVQRTDYWVGGVPGGSDLPAEVEALINPYRDIRFG